MEPALLGLVLDSSVLVAAERSFERRKFLDELKAHVPIHAVTEATAEIIARIGGGLERRFKRGRDACA
jgi:hypothetical protein